MKTTMTPQNQLDDLCINTIRFLSADGKIYKSYPWSTPVQIYKEIGGRRVAARAETVWHTPEGKFSYGRFNLADIEYNLKELK